MNHTRLALAATAMLALSACGKSVDANQSATADTVEIPAEQAMAGATAMPAETATDIATEELDLPSDAASVAAD
jgi:hypothetical protein